LFTQWEPPIQRLISRRAVVFSTPVGRDHGVNPVSNNRAPGVRPCPFQLVLVRVQFIPGAHSATPMRPGRLVPCDLARSAARFADGKTHRVGNSRMVLSAEALLTESRGSRPQTSCGRSHLPCSAPAQLAQTRNVLNCAGLYHVITCTRSTRRTSGGPLAPTLPPAALRD